MEAIEGDLVEVVDIKPEATEVVVLIMDHLKETMTVLSLLVILEILTSASLMIFSEVTT